jgi:hypothetical protein
MKKCIGITPEEWAKAKTPEEQQALIAASHVDLTPTEVAQRQAEDAKHEERILNPPAKPKSLGERLSELEAEFTKIKGVEK